MPRPVPILLLATCAALLLWGGAVQAGERGRDAGGEPRFALYAVEGLRAGPGLIVKGGDVGVARIAAGAAGAGDRNLRGATVVLERANVDGRVYGSAVALGPGSVVRQLFADEVIGGRGVKVGAVGEFPGELRSLAGPPRPVRSDRKLIAWARTTNMLSPLQAEVVVEDRATLVLAGGEYEVESLELGPHSRVEVLAPSVLNVTRRLQVGRGVRIGTPGQPNEAFLVLVVAGEDTNGRPAATVDDGARLDAVVRVPGGTLSLGDSVHVLGALQARGIAAADHLFVRYRDWTARTDRSPQCYRHECESTRSGRFECVSTLEPGLPCDDGNACTVPDVCNADGQCVAGPVVPDPDPDGEDPCLRDVCDPATGIFEPVGTVCDPEPECHAAILCDGAGQCALPDGPLPAGSFCDDGIAENGPDVCTAAAVCIGLGSQGECTENLCGDPANIECWLNDRLAIRNAVTWFELGSAMNYAIWSAARKQELQQAYEDSRAWLASGLTSFPGTVPAHPLPNALILADDESAGTALEESVAWPLYVASVGHALALEIGGHLPWSLCELDDLQLSELFWSASSHFSNAGDGYYTPRSRSITPAHPNLKYEFLVANGLIGATRFDTIANLAEWGRRLLHNIGASSTINAWHHWQYRGWPPVDRMISGTVNTFPGYGPVFGHFTRGCGGTQGFLKDVLLAVNIPVRVTTVPCGHAQPSFPTEAVHLSHGDDLYNFFPSSSTNAPPPGAIFVDAATFATWFDTSQPDACNNVGRRPVELATQIVPDWLASYYCRDVADNLSHANGRVYDSFERYYTVAELEAMGFWETVSQAALDLGLWCGGM